MDNLSKRTSKKQATRLLNSYQFNQVFSEPSFRLSNNFILILARESQQPTARLGLVVAKKKIPLAVNRNRFKRLAREYFRKSQKSLKNLDLVILSRDDISKLQKKEQNQTFEQIFSKLKK